METFVNEIVKALKSISQKWVNFTEDDEFHRKSHGSEIVN